MKFEVRVPEGASSAEEARLVEEAAVREVEKRVDADIAKLFPGGGF